MEAHQDRRVSSAVYPQMVSKACDECLRLISTSDSNAVKSVDKQHNRVLCMLYVTFLYFMYPIK